ncbi:hypothetical protein BDN70DRAFT_926559 [Pholiota conissans]|uniref:Uncharacterized protein n=1 Tax=Pholiota conissans TaxID=109636 RepID=A0A9P6D761_9AGAR|nr:hypothetical protein BDN70DRAFT_926559 [Pholiota conissans]
MVDWNTSLIAVRAPQNLSWLRPSFLGLHIAGGFVGLPILIITLLFSDDIPRQPDLINFCITWVIYSFSYTILGLSGKTAHPPHTLCFIQAAILQGTTPMVAIATFLLVFKTWRTFRDPFSPSARCILCFTLSVPYLVFILLLLISVGNQLAAPSTLNANNGLYCTTSGVPFRRYMIPIFSIILAALMIAFEIAIAVRYYRSRKRIITNFPLALRSTSLSLIIRLGLFNVYLFVTIGASSTFIAGRARAWAYMVQAALPLVAFILFATQRNILLTWCFWLKRKYLPNRCEDNIPESRSIRPSESGIDLSYTPIHRRDVACNSQPS